MSTITSVRAEEIGDSRGRPTLAVTVACGTHEGTFSVPSGASTGSTEACELRDADGHVTGALRNIHDIIAPAIMGMSADDQRAIDARLLELDGTPQKTRLGGNALIGVSIACAKAAAAANGVEVYQHLRTLVFSAPSRRVPYLYFNYINGGKHAHSPLAFQEHIIVPQTDSASEAIAIAEAVDDALRMQIADTYGPEAVETMGDEGGYVIPEIRYDAPFELLTKAIVESGNEGRVRLATDVAATSFFENGGYTFGGTMHSTDDLLLTYADLVARFDLLSIEDPFEESALTDFVRLQQALPQTRIVGDDLTTTNAARITDAAEARAMRAVIIKPNQIGTLSETLDAIHAARDRDIDCIVSHRSGDTMDTFIADLAFACGAFGLKSGSLRRTERRAKYDRLAALSV